MPEEIKTAVIAAAGQATRMWPASKVIPKELFPIGKVPAIARLVTELVDAGIRHVIVVVSAQSAGLMNALFDPANHSPAKVSADPPVRRFEMMLKEVQVTIVPQSGNYGNATPLIQSLPLIGNAPCIYAFGDDVVLGENATRSLIDIYRQTSCPVMAAQCVPASKKSSFGILECKILNGIHYVQRLVEKPKPDETTSDLASFGRYLVTPELLQIFRDLSPGRDNEVWFVDAVIRLLAKAKPVCALRLTTGTWYTVGDPVNYAEAVSAAVEADLQMDDRSVSSDPLSVAEFRPA